MTSTAQKKTKDKEVAANTSTAAQTPAQVAVLPALIAYHVIPAPAGQQPLLSPIGSAVAHDDGEGFTLNLQLMPTTGGRIILRKPQVKKAA